MSEWGEGALGAHRYLHFLPLTKRGVQHGFLYGSLDARGTEDDIVQRGGEVLSPLRLLKQEHGVRIVAPAACDEMPVADGWSFDLMPGISGTVGIRTADCMPVLLAHRNRIALVHAGWRGLAAGILEQAVQRFDVQRQDEILVLVGPCAGGADYEVGAELLGKFRSPPAIQRRNGAIFLDLARTAETLLRAVLACRVSVHSIDISTISDRRFHSHRRDGDRAGRNLAFVALGARASATE